jgi:phosphodiesterase/alkaline phosphatase D-like protein
MTARLHTKPAIAAALASLLFSSSGAAQQVNAYVAKEEPPAAKAPRVQIARGPELESADENSATIRWTSNNPGGSDEHFGVVHYGTSPKELNQTAKSHIRLNQKHAETVFRVSVEGLAPRTTYYYTVDSMQASGASDGIKSAVGKFTTPAPGERITNLPQPK